MAWKSGPNAALGIPTPGGSETTSTKTVGTIARFFDDALGDGEFIYLPGVADTVRGDLVEYDLAPGAPSTTRHSNATGTNSGRPLAVATANVGAGHYGWYQIGGVAIVNAVAGTVAGVAMGTATPGSIGNTADAGDQILGARIVTPLGTPEAGKVYAELARPHVQGQIT